MTPARLEPIASFTYETTFQRNQKLKEDCAREFLECKKAGSRFCKRLVSDFGVTLMILTVDSQKVFPSKIDVVDLVL